MAIDPSLTPIGSGFNRALINTNFERIDDALQDALSRSGASPNMMEADIDLNSNDLLNVGVINTERLVVDGEEFVFSEAIAKGDQGDAATISVGSVTTGAEGTDVIITNAGTTAAAVLNFTIPRGDTGASGAGSGDMVAAQNLNDVADKPTAFANIKQAATSVATGVVELATEAEAVTGTDTTRAVTPAGVAAAVDAGSGMVLLTSGTVSSTSQLAIDYSAYTDYPHIKIILSDCQPVTNNVSLRAQFSVDGGGSWDSAAFDYASGRIVAFGTNDGAGNTLTAGSYIDIETSIANTSYSGVSLEGNILNWQSTTTPAKALGTFVRHGSAFSIGIGTWAGFRLSAKKCNAIRFYFSSGNINNCKYSVYGYK